MRILRNGLNYVKNCCDMAKKSDFPKIKYKLINGNGSSVFCSWGGVIKQIERYRTDPMFKNKERFQPQYVIKITEEYIEI